MISLSRFGNSFRHAGHGVRYAWRHEQSFRIQVGVAVGVMAATIILPTETWERVVVSLVVVMVLGLELLNTVVERLLDAIQPRLAHYVEELKDLMAAVVMLAALAALVVGAVIFGPKLINLFVL